MEKREFLKEIQGCRRKLNLALVLKMMVFALSVGAVAGILLQVIAMLVPFYYANHYTVAAVLLAALTAVIAAYIKRCSMKQAALTMDSFGFQERIVTAYEHLEEESSLLQLQRQDAMKQLQAHKERIRIPVIPSWKQLLGVMALLVVMFGLVLVPTKTKEEAKKLQQVREEVKEKEEEIEEVVESLEELEQEILMPQQLEALQEMIESMQASIQEYQQVVSAEMLATANEKLEYKYGDMSSQLANLAASMQSGAAASVATAESMQAMSQQLQQMSGTQSLASNQGSNNGQSGQAGNSQNNEQNGQSDNGQGSNNQGSGQNSQGENGQNGQGSSGQGSDPNGQGGSGQGSGQNGQGSNGQGNGSGAGNGSGNGQGAGGGRGEGSSDTMHDYVSIPNAIVDSGNLTGTAQNHDNSEFFRTQNGLSWEGTHVSYDSVIGKYEQNAYEGISSGQYPSGMENVIKDYFASFN